MTNQLSTNEKLEKYGHHFELLELVEEDTGVEEEIVDRLDQISLEITAQLGKANLSVSDVLNLSEKSEDIELNELEPEERKKYVVELDKAIGEPITLLINDRPVAIGEVISQEHDNYRIRIVSITK